MKPWAAGFYGSKAWEETRMAYLIAHHYLCERCGQPAKIVHHKIYITIDNINDVNITLNWENLEALCQDCHNKEHHKTESTQRYTFDSDGNMIPISPH